MSLTIVAVLLAVLIPTLAVARRSSYREQCANNQSRLGQGWLLYIEDHAGEFPLIEMQPGWSWGGVRFPSADAVADPWLDPYRPINQYVSMSATAESAWRLFRCPADAGITDARQMVGTGARTAFRSFGTSYRANAMLLDAQLLGTSETSRPVRVNELLTTPSQMLLMGDPTWYEVYYQTNRSAHWHGGAEGEGNLLFLDGSVRYRTVEPRGTPSPVVIEPLVREGANGRSDVEDEQPGEEESAPVTD